MLKHSTPLTQLQKKRGGKHEWTHSTTSVENREVHAAADNITFHFSKTFGYMRILLRSVEFTFTATRTAMDVQYNTEELWGIFLSWNSCRYDVLICACVRACGYQGGWACACAYVHIALLIQHATPMRHIVTSFVAPLAPPNFSTLSHKRWDFRKKLLNIKCLFLFYLQRLSKPFLILRRIYRDIVINVETPLRKIPVIVVGF